MGFVKNSWWSIFGLLVPVLIAIPCMGFLARELGVEQFGVFTVIYAVVGFAGVLDAGITRAVVRYVALSEQSKEAVIVNSSLYILFLVGAVVSLAILFFSNEITSFLNVTADLREGVNSSLKMISFSIIPLLVTNCCYSSLEGNGKFFRLSFFKFSQGLVLATFPIIFLLFDHGIFGAVLGLFVARIVMCLATICFIYFPAGYAKCFEYSAVTIKELLSFGSWVAVSNILSPLMTYVDRLVLSNVSGTASVGFYTAPMEAVSRSLIIPSAICKVLFARLSAKSYNARHDRIISYFSIVLMCLPISAIFFFFAENIIYYWLGSDFVEKSSLVLKILAVGYFFNSLAQVPFADIQANGYSNLTAYAHILEVVPYLSILYLLIIDYSFVGAAIAWSSRVIFDYVVLEIISKKYGIVSQLGKCS